jgi:hypothetical protein
MTTKTFSWYLYYLTLKLAEQYSSKYAQALHDYFQGHKNNLKTFNSITLNIISKHPKLELTLRTNNCH